MLDPKFCTSPTIADQPVWLKFDFDSAVTFSSYDIWAGTYYGQNPKHWSVACEAPPPPTPQPTTPLPTVGYVETVKLGLSNQEGSQQFGSSVAISSDGNLVAVGAERSSATGDDTGGAYVFRTSDDGASWVQVAELVESDAEGALGEGAKSVAIAGDFVAVGKRGTKTVYVFRTADDGATWSQVAKLTPTTIGTADWFGGTVAISSDLGVVVAGAGGETDWPNGLENQGINQCGAVYVFRTTDGGATYGQVAKLTASDAALHDRFGYSVAIDGSTIVVGADWDDDAGSQSGSAYVFRTTDNGATWVQTAKLTASDATSNDLFGCAVAIYGDTIVVGAYAWTIRGGDGWGSAYVFRTTDGGATYLEVAILTASDAAVGDNFGCSVAIAADTVVVGARFDDVNGNDSGSVYVFRTTDGGATYSQVAKLTADRALGHVAGDDFGDSVAIDGATVVVGVKDDDDGGTDSGAAIIFRTSDGGASYVKVAKLTASDAAADDQFGKSVAIAGDTVVVGTSGHLQRLGRRRGRSWR